MAEMDEGRKTFVTEAGELLEEMESALLTLEAAPANTDAINAVFRAVHTIKGSAGIVGVDNVQGFAHIVESVLDRVRNGEVAVATELISLMLECRDHLATLVAEGVGAEPEEQYTAVQEHTLTSSLNRYLTGQQQATVTSEAHAKSCPLPAEGEGPIAETGNWHLSVRFSPDVFRHGMDPASFFTYLQRLGEIVCISTIDDALPPLAAMDPEACYIGFELDLQSDADKAAIEDVFEFLRDDCRLAILPPRSRVASYITLIEDLPEDNLRLGEILVKGGALTRKEMESALKIQTADYDTRLLGDILVGEGMAHQSVVDAALARQSTGKGPSQQAAKAAREAASIRVDTEKLDLLINSVGEMVIAGATINSLAQHIKDNRLRQAVGVMARLIEDIRDRSMRVRMIPLQETFNKFQRVVRDIAQERGKEIALEIRGGDTEVDRTVIERIKDPLMHIVRNAADHGIEHPAERVSAGKPESGTVSFNAYQETGDIIIEVSDDGKGLDDEKIFDKAVERGLVKPDASLTRDEIVNLIFEPGFSTAAEVTNISGRGVGMDVVKRNITALRGSVSLESAKGEGSKVTIRLPLTLAIIDGFLVTVEGSSYVVPMDMVIECMSLSDADRKASHGRDHIVVRGHILPYIRMRELFGLSTGNRPKFEHVLVVRHAGRSTGLLVDTLLGEVQTVVKSLGRVYKNIEGISGATILGDGTVALILDVPRLVNLATRRAEAE